MLSQFGDEMGWIKVIALALVIATVAGTSTVRAAAKESAPLDYSSVANWVCLPRLARCQFDLDATIIDAQGRRSIEPFRPATNPKADCFYVYPTVSVSPGLSAEPPVTARELEAVRQQAARFGSICRLYVPFYRQITYTSMKAGFVSRGRDATKAADQLADDDLLAAWDYYVAHDNGGRPFVLVGHSQGSMRLIRLIQKRIDGRPIQLRMLSAILPGAFVLTPAGKSVGGTFKSIPPCRKDGQTECFLAFNSIRAETVLRAEVKPNFPGQELVCTNPATLAGGDGELKAYLSSSGKSIIPELTAKQPQWTRAGGAVRTPFVRLPGLYFGECRIDGHGAFLAVTTRARPGDVRTGRMSGDWVVDGKPVPEMGLHLIDLNLTAGNLIDVIDAQLRVWHGRKHLLPAHS